MPWEDIPGISVLVHYHFDGSQTIQGFPLQPTASRVNYNMKRIFYDHLNLLGDEFASLMMRYGISVNLALL
jgi:hypothetical protein